MELFGTTEEEKARIRAGEENMEKYNKAVASKRSDAPKDPNAFLGPNYSFADELPSPKEIGVRSGGSPGAIIDAAAGMNYYVDAIGFGEKTGINFTDMKPLGIRYFMNTGATCSNGASMYEYIDTTPKGNLMGKRVGQALQDMGLPGMKG